MDDTTIAAVIAWFISTPSGFVMEISAVYTPSAVSALLVLITLPTSTEGARSESRIASSAEESPVRLMSKEGVSEEDDVTFLPSLTEVTSALYPAGTFSREMSEILMVNCVVSAD